MSEMLTLAHNINELLLLMSLSWPTAASEKWCANPHMGLFCALLHLDDWLTLSHEEHSWLPHETSAWAYVAFSQHDG
jgi:hypothetical protein